MGEHPGSLITQRCLICGAALPLAGTPGARTCGSVECAWVDRSLPPDRRCRICGRPLELEQSARGLCSALPCRQENHDRQLAIARSRLVSQADQLLARLRPASDLPPDTPVQTVLLPSMNQRASRLPARRRAAFRHHLESMVAGQPSQVPRPVLEPTDPLEANGETTRALHTACGTCGGHCCSFGDTHAYLRPETIEQVRRSNPDLTDADLVAHYMEALPQLSIQGSCVYHTRHGCAIERDWRADLCNSFYCAELNQFRLARPGPRALPVFFAAADSQRVVRGTLVTASHTTSASRPKDC